MNFIKNESVVSTEYTLAAGNILSLEDFLALDEGDRDGKGVWVDSHEEVELLADKLDSVPVVALNFPAFTDGRAYSSASILRRHYNYAGEIRAIGDVRIDQLEQMRRCGFDAYELAEDQNVERAIGTLAGFSYSYQKAYDREPLFRVERKAA